MPKKLTTEEFRIQLSIEHPELELLSEYNGNKKYVTVRCKKHNYIFNTKPNWLHSGRGCQKCYDERRGETTRKTQEEFINDLERIYKNKNYDFSKVHYINSNTKVTIICPKHGEFYPTPNHIITRGDGCPCCANEENGIKKRLTTEEFIKRAKQIHGEKYDYSKVKYVTNVKPITIICPKHGEFIQNSGGHINGHGCPLCNESSLEREVRLLLSKYNILFIRQKKFDWLGRKSLDFYIPSRNIAIECQGLQHFELREHFGGEEGLRQRIKLDITKNTECEENNIKIIYIVENKEKINYNNPIYNGIYNNVMTIEEFEKWLLND